MTDESRYDANSPMATARQALRRFGVSTVLWTFGVVAILAALVSLGLQILVPLLSLENDQLNRADNPHTLANVFSCGTAGVIAIIAARSSDRKRMWIGIAVAMTAIMVGFYEFGVFG